MRLHPLDTFTRLHAEDLDADALVHAIQRDGLCVVEGCLPGDMLPEARAVFESCFEQQRSCVRQVRHPTGRNVRIDYAPGLLCANPDLLPLLSWTTAPVLRQALDRLAPGTELGNWTLTDDVESGPLTDVHFDGKRAIKCMVYLDDVGEGDGAFSYASGTHEQNAAFRRLFLSRGGRPAELPNAMAPNEPVCPVPVHARAGSCVIFDTEGAHRGGHLAPGHRRRAVRARRPTPAEIPSHLLARGLRSRLNPIRKIMVKRMQGNRRLTRGTARVQDRS